MVVYLDGPWNVEVGVEIFAEVPIPIQENDFGFDHSATPAGRVAVTTHWGRRAVLTAAHIALRRWCAVASRPATGPSWEVHGDRKGEPTRRRTDVYLLIEPR